MKNFVRLSHFKVVLYLGIFLGLATTASTVTGIIIPTCSLYPVKKLLLRRVWFGIMIVNYVHGY